MAEPIKLKQEELDSLRKIQSKYQEKIYLFGQFYLERVALDEKIKQLSEAETKARDEYLSVQKEEQDWVNKIAESYGDGNLSLADGTFTPNSKA
jgi:hypothetical protein